MDHNHPRSHFCRMIEKQLSLEESNLAMNFGMQSEAVALADAGMFLPNLKSACRCVLISGVEQYMEHSHVSKARRVALLDKKKKH
eukprot:11101166-Ditylum_brightwellii.AAC.1